MPQDHWPGFGVVFTGFQVIARQPVLWATWTVLSLATLAATIFAVYGISLIPSLSPPAPSPLADMSRWLIFDRGWRQLLSLPVYCAGYGVSIAAYTRAALEPTAGERSYIRLGWTELQIGLAALALFVVIDLVGFALGLSAAIAQDARLSLAILTAYLGLLGAALWICSQFWLAPSDMISTTHSSLRTVWRLGAGRRARLFWTLIVTGLLALVLTVVGQAVSVLAWANIAHQPVTTSWAAILVNMISPYRQAATPWAASTWVSAGVYSLFGSVAFAVVVCPAARIYASLCLKVDEVF